MSLVSQSNWSFLLHVSLSTQHVLFLFHNSLSTSVFQSLLKSSVPSQPTLQPPNNICPRSGLVSLQSGCYEIYPKPEVIRIWPRRVSAMSVATRVAQVMGVKLEDEETTNDK